MTIVFHALFFNTNLHVTPSHALFSHWIYSPLQSKPAHNYSFSFFNPNSRVFSDRFLWEELNGFKLCSPLESIYFAIKWCRRYDDFGDACIWNGDARKVAENIILWSLDLWFSCFCSGQFFLLKLLVFKIFSFLPLIRLCWSKLITHTHAKKMNESKIEREKVGENSVYWIEWKKKSVITRYKTMCTIYRFS
jgi:hypothetical protein